MSDTPKTYSLEAVPRLPDNLGRLPELASNLMYSWDQRIRGLFWRLDQRLWASCGNNPKIFLRRVSQKRLETAAHDPDFLYDYYGALAAFDLYLATAPDRRVGNCLDTSSDLVAYFCAEYGLHESLPIYSGGLGILAGDHCKAASDLGVPLVAVGLLYREGYFTQRIDGHGQQHAVYLPVTSDDLPISLALADDGNELRVGVPVEDRTVQLRVWQARAGHTRMLLLDSDVAENNADDRRITYQLYGGGSETRIRQCIVLGIGGVRALRALGFNPSTWHVNEGHAAFSILERVREHVAGGLGFDAALELVAAGTVFTTHTVVPAGHDRFSQDQLGVVLGRFLDELGAPREHVLNLGSEPTSDLFNMTALSLRGARSANGVSRVHRKIAASMERYIWPQIDPADNPLRAITNGVHMPTFMARNWTRHLHEYFPEWTQHLQEEAYWQAIDDIEYRHFVSIRQRLKRDLLTNLAERLRRQHLRNGTPEATINRVLQHIQETSSEMLVLGFARRFATYKRANLMLRDRDRLARILNDPGRPAILVIAGKAHPRDEPGQALIREIYQASMQPEFIGRIVVVEGYDLHFARNLVQGCDVWINTPEYPLEACGTSGMKAGINGVVNLSVLDGWWPEGYTGSNGFAVQPVGTHLDARERSDEEARQLLDIVEHQVVPLYYREKHQGWSEGWVRLAKNAMKTTIPRFNAQRMMLDYLRDSYVPAIQHARRLGRDEAQGARQLAEWKSRIARSWGDVSLELEQGLPNRQQQEEDLKLRIKARLNGLLPTDVMIECVFGQQGPALEFDVVKVENFDIAGTQGEWTFYELQTRPLTGLQQLRLRAYPYHPHLAHRFETGCMRWL